MKKHVIHFILLVSVAFCISSCRTAYIAGIIHANTTKKDTLVKHVNQLTKTAKMWQIVYTLDVEKEGLTVEGKVRIIRDSLIWISVTKMGLEAMRVKMTQDSVWILDRLKNKYFQGDYSTFERFAKLPFDFQLCQSIFLNEPYPDLINAKNLQVTDSLLIFRGEINKPDRQMNIEQTYFLPSVYLQGFSFSSKSSQLNASITYDYKEKFKMNGFKLKTSSPNLPSAYFRTREIEEKDKLSTKFKISKRYEEIRF